MKLILLLYLGICTLTSSESRLIEKITDRTLTTEIKKGSSPPVRLARQIYPDDVLSGFSAEESDDFFPNFNKIGHIYREEIIPELHTRIRRDSSEHDGKVIKNISSIVATPREIKSKTKPALVKKPIPKYNEMDYDDDFQMKISKSPIKIVDSGEHEDEDFNLDDYDFDINHDEFIGRGKPLEPRLKQKEFRGKPKSDTKQPTAPEIKIKSKVVATQHRQSPKKERSLANPRKVSEKDDYEEDSSKRPQRARDLEDEFNEDNNEESKEYDSKMSNVRMVRSPWKIDSAKVHDKMSKSLTILPMFPQMPTSKTGVHEIRFRNQRHSDQ